MNVSGEYVYFDYFGHPNENVAKNPRLFVPVSDIADYWRELRTIVDEIDSQAIQFSVDTERREVCAKLANQLLELATR